VNEVPSGISLSRADTKALLPRAQMLARSDVRCRSQAPDTLRVRHFVCESPGAPGRSGREVSPARAPGPDEQAADGDGCREHSVSSASGLNADDRSDGKRDGGGYPEL
jgi:hypothetical protein